MFIDKAIRAAREADRADVQEAGIEQRRFERTEVRCPVRVRIGNRQYAAWLDNASDAGVKLSTACTIKPAERVILQIPDLPPMKGELRWVGECEAGIAFPLLDGHTPLSAWLNRRAAAQPDED